MLIVGGIYRETCARPKWDRIFGSGGRAATALAALCSELELFGYASENYISTIEHSLGPLGVKVNLTQIADSISFDYLHPLSRPSHAPPKIGEHPPIEVTGNVVLRFGMIEGDAKVSAEWAIYDPQTGGELAPFSKNGSSAKHLAVVLNENEALKIGEASAFEAAQRIRSEWGAEVVVVKLGTRGALVSYGRDEYAEIPPYLSDKVFKIGSGDIFSAVFSYCWGIKRMSPVDAADKASAAVAEYVETRTLPFRSLEASEKRAKVEVRDRGQIYLAGPFFDVSQRWMINEALSVLEILGAKVFSPIHDIGPSDSSRNVALEDLEGLDHSSAVLALVDSRDPGTLLEVGYAIKSGKTVVILAERLPQHELTMFNTPECIVTDDFSTSLYKAVWSS